MSLMNSSANSDYVAISNNEAASIIAKFDMEMIDDVIDQALETKFRSYSPRLLNLVDSIEQVFKSDIAQFPQLTNDLIQKRFTIYSHIINKVLAAHNLQLLVDTTAYPDIYSLAHMIYDLLVANFNSNVIAFFTNYIVKEKSTIYEALNLVDKKSDMANAVYSKKIFKNGKNSKLAIIHANLDFVVSTICGWDIDLAGFISYAYIDNRPIANALIPILADNGRFFLDHIVGFYNQNFAVMSTNIKFALQNNAVMNIQDADVV